MADEIEYIRNLLLTQKKPSYQTTNKKEVRVRCPYCQDGKNPADAHFYIKMQPPFCFHCFKCETSGVLTNNTLRDLNIFDNDAAVNLINASKNFKANSGIQKLTYKKKNLINKPVDSKISRNAVNYFNNRFHSNFTNEYIVNQFKTVTDPIAFFNENNIIPMKDNFGNSLYNFEQAIGFISSDSSHIIFRDLSGQQKSRYFNLSLCPDEYTDMNSKMYNIKSDIDILQDKIDLVITEGIFDIIGVYTHFYQNNNENTIFAAACGKAYNAVILNYIRKGFLNLNITIYSDGDVDLSFYKALKYNSPYLKNSKITIYYNNLYDPKTKFGKDYGVPIEQIQLRKTII